MTDAITSRHPAERRAATPTAAALLALVLLLGGAVTAPPAGAASAVVVEDPCGDVHTRVRDADGNQTVVADPVAEPYDVARLVVEVRPDGEDDPTPTTALRIDLCGEVADDLGPSGSYGVTFGVPALPGFDECEGDVALRGGLPTSSDPTGTGIVTVSSPPSAIRVECLRVVDEGPLIRQAERQVVLDERLELGRDVLLEASAVTFLLDEDILDEGVGVFAAGGTLLGLRAETTNAVLPIPLATVRVGDPDEPRSAATGSLVDETSRVDLPIGG